MALSTSQKRGVALRAGTPNVGGNRFDVEFPLEETQSRQSLGQAQSQMMPVLMSNGGQMAQVPMQWVGGASPHGVGTQMCFLVPMQQETVDRDVVDDQNFHVCQTQKQQQHYSPENWQGKDASQQVASSDMMQMQLQQNLQNFAQLHQLLEEQQQHHHKGDEEVIQPQQNQSAASMMVTMVPMVPHGQGENGDAGVQRSMHMHSPHQHQQQQQFVAESDRFRQRQGKRMPQCPPQEMVPNGMWQQGNPWPREDEAKLPYQPTGNWAIGEGDACLPYYASHPEDGWVGLMPVMPVSQMPERNWGERRAERDGHRGGMKNFNQMRGHVMDHTGQPKGPMLKQRMAPMQYPEMLQQIPGHRRRQEADGRRPKMKMDMMPSYPHQDQQGGTGESPAFEEPQSHFGGMRAGRNRSQLPDQLHGLPGTGAAETMKAQLQALQLADESTVFIARRINKLGFSSAEVLRAYFSRYGPVENVYVSHSRVKSLKRLGGERRSADAHWRLRAAALGFVVMQSAQATSQILADGPDHTINNVTVRLQAFHRRTGALENEDDLRDQEAVDELCGDGTGAQDYPRWPSPGSDTEECTDRQSLQKMPVMNGKPMIGMTEKDILYNNFVLTGGPVVHSRGQQALDADVGYYSD